MSAARLPPLLAPGLTIVFVGTEPGPESLQTQSYYANTRNSFWYDLHVTGLTPTVIEPAEYRVALMYRLGLDDVNDDAAALRHRIAAAAPRAVCFNSKAALDRVALDQVQGRWSGEGAGRWVAYPGVVVWALHDSSPRAAAYHSLRIDGLQALKERLDPPAAWV